MYSELITGKKVEQDSSVPCVLATLNFGIREVCTLRYYMLHISQQIRIFEIRLKYFVSFHLKGFLSHY